MILVSVFMKRIFCVWCVLFSLSYSHISMADPLEDLIRQSSKNSPARGSDSRAGAQGDQAGDLIMNAMGLLGVAYRFGGTNPGQGLDCSGFMQYVFRQSLRINLPRTAAEMARVGNQVARSDLQPGDMVFFNTSGSRISHVGMYIGNNRFIHAPRTGKNIEITDMGQKYWNSRFVTARRVSNADKAARFVNQ